MSKLKLIKLFIIIIFIVLGIYSFFIEPNKIKITEYTIKDKSLKDIKIVFISDMHVKKHQKKRLKEIVSFINEQNPDIVLSTGDFLSGHIKFLTMPINDIAKEFQNITAQGGFYTSLGNHEQYFGSNYITNELEKYGINVLNNSNKKVNIKGKEIYIAGIQYKPKDINIIIESLKYTKPPIIMLSHSPDEIKKMSDKINLILSGHTHGGQFVIPFIGPIVTCSKYGAKYAYGLIEENGRKMIVTNGIGVSILPFRFNCIPEIVVINFTE